MSFLGPGVQFKLPRSKAAWRQGWWWRDRVPLLVTVVALLLAVVVPLGVVWALHHGDSDPEGSDGDFPGSGSQVSRSTGPVRLRESPPMLPDVAHTQTAEGIKATVRFEYAALNYAQRTGDLEPLKQVFDTESCSTCALLVERLSGLAARGKHLDGADYVLENLEAYAAPGPDGTLIGYALVSVGQPKDYVIVDAAGGRSTSRPGQPVTKTNHTLKFYQKWLIVSSSVEQK